MTRAALLGLVTALVATAPAGSAPRERTETIPYDRPAGIHVMDLLWAEVAADDELPEARPIAGERTVSVVVEDESGNPVAAVIHQGKRDLGEICGATASPVPLVSRQPVHVHVYSGPACGGASIATRGTVTFTFAR